MSKWLEPLSRGTRAYIWLSLFCACMYLPGLSTIPVLDRDEARYAQASRQMLQSGDFVRIQFQDTPRHKKPVAVYWLQAGAAALLGNARADNIAPYRLVSAVSAWLAVLMTLVLARRLFRFSLNHEPTGTGTENPQRFDAEAPNNEPPSANTREALHADRNEHGDFEARANLFAFVAALTLAACFGLMAEAHQAKTDALLCLCVVAMQLGLCRVFLSHAQPANFAYRTDFPWLFWIALGVGTMTKGPVAPAIAALTLTALLLQRRSWRLAGALYPLRGALLCVAIVAPWSVAIYLATDGQFFSQAASEDFLPKLVSGHESHGAPPGYYLLVMLLMFWPGSMLALPALGFALVQLRNRTTTAIGAQPAPLAERNSRALNAVGAKSAVSFLLCWLLPTWVVLELIPTKLPHYTLPLYPALALLVGIAALGLDRQHRPCTAAAQTGISWLWATHSVLWVLVTLALGAAFATLPLLLQLPLVPIGSLMALVLGVGALLACLQIRRRRLLDALLSGIASSLIFSILLTAVYVPALEPLWISQRLANIAERVDPQRRAQIFISGYHEPSVVFSLGTQTRLTDSSTASDALQTELPTISILATEIGANNPAIPTVGATAGIMIARFVGFNYSKGKQMRLSVFTNIVGAQPQRAGELK